MQIPMDATRLQRAVRLHIGTEIATKTANKILKQFSDNEKKTLVVLNSTQTKKPILHIVRCKAGLRVVPALFEVTLISLKKE